MEKKKEVLDRTDDPVRMYLREMGAVELLSREGEIAIAKRIEAGRNTMIEGLCESPLTFTSMIAWSEALNAGEMQLREILDLDAMLNSGPSDEQVESDSQPDLPSGVELKEDEEPEAEPEKNEDEDDYTEKRAAPLRDDDEEEDNTLSLAQMEEQLKPQALEQFAAITTLYKKFLKLQDARLDALNTGQHYAPAQEKKYQGLREDLTEMVAAVHFHNAKIEFLVDQLYSYNRQLMTLGGNMLRLAERYRINRQRLPRRLHGQRARRGLARPCRRRRRQVGGVREERARLGRKDQERDRRHRAADRCRARRVPPHRQHGPEGRARGAHRQEGNGRGEPPARHLDRQEIHEPRPAIP